MSGRLVNLVCMFVTTCLMFTFVLSASALDSKYARWLNPGKPLKVYIEQSASIPGFTKDYPHQVALAFAKWKSDTKGLVNFVFVNNKNQADIQVSWASKISKTDAIGATSGHSYVWAVTKLGNPTRIILGVKHPLNEKEALSAQNVYMISLHEIGHSLGIWWHTRDPRDIMYPEFLIPSTTANGSRMIRNKNLGSLSSRDIDNLKALYNNNNVTILDKIPRGNQIALAATNNKLGAVETTGTMGAGVGKKSTDLEINLGEAMNQLRKNPNSHEAYNNIGLIYMQAGEYNKAVENFGKSLNINPSYAKAHFNLALTFVRVQNYDKAINEYEQYLNLQPNASNSEDVKKEIERLKTLSAK